jgi:small-conductance mechanosensitive channel
MQIIEILKHNIILDILLILIGAYVASFIFVSIFKNYLHEIKLIPDNFSVIKHFNKPIWLMISLFSIKALFPYIEFINDNRITIEKIWLLVTISVIAYFLTKITTFLKVVIFKSLELKSDEEFKYRKFKTQLQFTEKFIVVTIYLAAFVIAIMSFDEIKKFGGSIIASAGLAGVIIGFAAQKSLANLIAGFQIAFTQPFKIGDTVIVDGEWGHIKEITLTYIVINSWDKRNLVVPITYLLEKPFQNWTRSNEKTMGLVHIYVDYSMPVEALREEFKRLVALSPHWDGEKAYLHVIDATEKTIQIRAVVSADTADDAYDIKVYLREHLIKFIQQNYPQCLPRTRIDSPVLSKIAD